MFAGIRRWDIVLTIVLMVALTVFELLGVFSPKMVTITQLIKATIPMPVRWMIIGWTFWHFIVSDLVRVKG